MTLALDASVNYDVPQGYRQTRWTEECVVSSDLEVYGAQDVLRSAMENSELGAVKITFECPIDMTLASPEYRDSVRLLRCATFSFVTSCDTLRFWTCRLVTKRSEGRPADTSRN